MKKENANAVVYTKAQEEAIHSRGKSILVSAGAGSGKTAVMTARITELIVQKLVNADELLVVTFTRAAASQMKKKIRDSLMKAAKKENSPYLYKQLSLLDVSQISTVHTLCSWVIKEFYQVAEIDPSYSMIVDAEEEVLLQEAVEEAFEVMYEEGNEGFSTLIEDFSTGITDDAVRESVKRLYRFMRDRIDAAWLKGALEAYNLNSIEEFEKSHMIKSFIEYNLCKVEEAEHIFEDALKLTNGTDSLPEVADVLESYLEIVRILKKHLMAGDSKEYLKQLMQVNFKRFDIRKPYENKELIKLMQDNGKKIIKDELKKKFFFSLEEYFSQVKDLAPGMNALGRLVVLTDEIYARKKKENISLDFSDLEHLCLKVLRNDDARGKIQKRFKYVFVDEYQDTNDVQEKIINLISQGDNLFVVGDVKQSIYRFRNAEPAIFSLRRCLYENAPEKGMVVSLADNFRSDKKIISAVNELFGKIMFQQSGGVDYIKNNEYMISSKEYMNSSLPEVQVITSKGNKEDDVLCEAKYIASLINKMVECDEIFDSELGALRKVRFSDIAVLMRSVSGNAETYVKAFEEMNIPINSPENTGFYDLTEIALVLDVMRVTDNFRNDIALAGAMRSFLYGFDEDDLLKIRAAKPECAYFHECVLNYEEYGDDVDLKARLNHFINQINFFVQFSITNSLEDLVGEIYSVTGLFNYVGTLPNGGGRQANLRYFKSLAASYEATSAKGLGSFIRYAQKAKENSKFKKNHISAVSDCVALMSVHKSKGLEFNVVIVADCGRRYSASSLTPAILYEKNLGICPSYRSVKKNYKSASLPKALASSVISEDESKEEMRILYVAATRAVQRLYFVGTLSQTTIEKLSGEVSEYSAKRASSFMTLLLPALRNSPYVKCLIIDESKETEIKQHDDEKDYPSPDNVKADVGLRERVTKRLSYSYPISQVKVPTKMSVSAIKESETLTLGEHVVALSNAPEFGTEKGRITPAIKGTMIHYLLQHISLDKAREDVSLALNETLKESEINGIIPENALNKEDISLVSSFLNSSLGEKLIWAEQVQREYEFIMRLKASLLDDVWNDSNEYILVQGVIDCLFEEKGKRYIIDYKTDRGVWGERREHLNRIYSSQVKMYALACEKMNKKVDEAYICYLRTGENFRVEI